MKMADTAADVLLDTIHHFGIDVIFGRPGPGTEGLMAALSRRQGKLRFIQTQHEEGGAFMACAYAKFTGKLGVCLASGLSGARMLNGLYDACLDGVPVLALTGGRDREVIGAFGRQAVHLDRLLADVSIYNERLIAPEQAAKIAGVACRAAIRAAGVAHLHL